MIHCSRLEGLLSVNLPWSAATIYRSSILPSAELEASIVFVGYGISDPAGGLDDYAGIDVRNKVVLFLRGKPERYATAGFSRR
jgi:hypothetical protein